MNDRSLIRMEKRATNHVGLFFVFLLTFVGLGVGGYLLYKNKDNISFVLPWEKEEYEEKKDEPIIDDNKDNTSNGKLYLPEVNPDTNIIAGNSYFLGLYLKKLTATPKGYNLTLEYTKDSTTDLNQVTFIEGPIILTCDKILLDEYEISPTFKLEFERDVKMSDQVTITIPIEELENLEMVSFNSIYFFITLETNIPNHVPENPEDKYTNIEGMLMAYQDVDVTNYKQIEKSFSVQNKVRISYYKKIEAEDATYLYFQIDNAHQQDSQIIQLKKLIINDEIYNKTNINVKTHYD